VTALDKAKIAFNCHKRFHPAAFNEHTKFNYALLFLEKSELGANGS
jgi:hypothetical protein